MKSKQKSTQTTTPIAPAWVAPQVESLSGKTADLANQDPYSFVAGADPLQTQAATQAGQLGQNSQSYDLANSTLSNLAKSGANTYDPATVRPNSILPNLDAYMSPYLDKVVNASLADYDYGAGQAVGQARLSRATSDTFGGSGGDVQMGSTLSGLVRGRGTLAEGLRNQGFGVGSNLANLDADRRQQAQMTNMDAFNNARQFGVTQSRGAANDLINVDTARTADQRATNGLQMDMGSILQALQQRKQGAPLTVNSAINGSYGSLSPMQQLLTGQTMVGKSSGSPGLLGSLGQVAQIAGTAAMFSDERLKEDIETVGHDAKGRRWVEYRYVWDEPGTRHRGVLAQEVAKTDPHAVFMHPSGFLMVNYGDLD